MQKQTLYVRQQATQPGYLHKLSLKVRNPPPVRTPWRPGDYLRISTVVLVASILLLYVDRLFKQELEQQKLRGEA
ncbi:hypothetical protein IE53DRAFT_388740 [Violaceomyces palustris]|uniref:Uncharacterized protein n=1 Tax=Violaceomyces palustris TaxID=1673888 RepID=A0ACD0NTC5_9BASI|nr:hypothetical protein IE53DRAFT_388740 [Violaceomyces palustris]